MERLRLVRSTLQRIRQIILECVRSYESTNDLSQEILEIARINLQRISGNISNETFNKLSNGITDLLALKSSLNRTLLHYSAPRINLQRRGRPMVQITDDQIIFLYNEGFTATSIAKHLSCSKSTVFKKLNSLNLKIRQRYTNISQEDLRRKIEEIHRNHPNAGHVMMQSYLGSENIIIQRWKVRKILNEVDPIGTASRWSKGIKRRVYNVKTPNSLWHMDAHLKLSRWGFVIHGCIDGYSRLIIYLKCEISIQPEPVLNLFTSAVQKFGLPSRVRSDHGYENILVAVLMNLIRGLHRGSHITGKSTHNQRIERLWVDVVKEVCDSVRTELYSLENDGLLDPDNLTHRFCVQQLYKDIINEKLTTFKKAWNMHKIRTAKSKTPRQLWIGGLLNNYNLEENTAINEIFNVNNVNFDVQVQAALQNLGVNTNIIEFNEDNPPSVSRFQATIEMRNNVGVELNNILSSGISNRDKYIQCLNCLNE